MMQPVMDKYPDVFGGLVIETECNRVVVYRLASAAFDREVRAAVRSDRRLLLRPALHSQAELLAFSQKVQADVAYWKSRGIDVNSTGPAPDGSSLIVGTMQVDKVRAEFPDRYGPEIAIYPEEVGQVVPL
jgi:galactokinase/mevalonate kinase-like predicted kinase